MAKKPVPKKHRAKRATRMQHSHYLSLEVRRLRDKSQSPYAAPAVPKNQGDKALKSITRIKA
ncbi:MAG: hypothetical protein KBC95_00365 [Candidatus Peribacteraceae bacterium]|nr:hypothetical protein [Candidatus Peribacteraceae bacterium]